MEKRLPLRWFKFYVYIRFPLGLISSGFLLLKNPQSSFLWFGSALMLVLFIGLMNKKLWAWKLNFGYLVYEALLMVLAEYSLIQKEFSFEATDSKVYLAIVIAIGLAWIILNWIYFKKRKYIFKNVED